MGFKGRSVEGEPLLEEEWSLEGGEEEFEDMVGRSGIDQVLGIWKCIIVVSGKRVTGLYIEFSGHPPKEKSVIYGVFGKNKLFLSIYPTI